MKREDYQNIEAYMRFCMEDSAHDQEHIYRVLYTALDIASSEKNVDTDVLIAACLLHDIGRKEQFEDPALCHAKVGAEKAYGFLTTHGFTDEFARHVSDCISTHRFRSDEPPATLEAQILFDADKIDVTGTLGIARTLLYVGIVGEPLYSLDENGMVSDGTGDEIHSFFKEYKYKLEGLYAKFYTERGQEIAQKRQGSARTFYESMVAEIRGTYRNGGAMLGLCVVD